VRSSQTSQGIATSAAREVAAWAFAQTNLVRLEIVVAVGNVGSQRVAEKVGARREGVLRKRLFLNGRSEDALMFALFRPE
jgi:RimJ/RimL family protein N-acetyltransferase